MDKNRDDEEKNELENLENSNEEVPNDRAEPRVLPFSALMLAAHSEWFKSFSSSEMQDAIEQKILLDFDEKTIDALAVYMSHKQIDPQIVRIHKLFFCACVNAFVNYKLCSVFFIY